MGFWWWDLDCSNSLLTTKYLYFLGVIPFCWDITFVSSYKGKLNFTLFTICHNCCCFFHKVCYKNGSIFASFCSISSFSSLQLVDLCCSLFGITLKPNGCMKIARIGIFLLQYSSSSLTMVSSILCLERFIDC